MADTGGRGRDGGAFEQGRGSQRRAFIERAGCAVGNANEQRRQGWGGQRWRTLQSTGC
jgi:hypothetical protein